LPPERLIILSQDGVAEWYGPIARRYLDVRTLFSPSEFEHQQHRTVPQSEQNPKVAMASPFDTEILERAARAFDLSEYQVLHPSLMFRVIRRVVRDRATGELSGLLKHERLRAPALVAVDGLPPSFVAVSLAYTSVLPKSEENTVFLQAMVEELAGERDVVILDRVPPPEVTIPGSPRVHRLDVLADGKVPSELQARVLSRASAFFGGYGDLSMLAAYCGVPAVAYHTDRLPEDSADRLQAAATSGEWAAVSIQRARRFKGIRFPAEAKAR
jgi:hypothetical protein